METRNVRLSLEKAKEFYKKGGEFRDLALSAFAEEELTKKELPKTWDEYLNIMHKEDSSKYLSAVTNYMDSCTWSCKALRMLRDCYRQGWEPDWSNREEIKYCIIENDGIEIAECYLNRQFLSFRTQELAEQFLENFRDIIIEADIL